MQNGFYSYRDRNFDLKIIRCDIFQILFSCSYCSRNQKTCSGSPCTTPSPSPSPTPTIDMNEQTMPCRQGWSVWVNSDKGPRSKLRSSDVEPLPAMKDLVMSDLANVSKLLVQANEFRVQFLNELLVKLNHSLQRIKQKFESQRELSFFQIDNSWSESVTVCVSERR